MLMEYMAECCFCGQLVAIDAKTALDESEKLESAKRLCACEGASRWRLQEEVYEKINNVFGAGAMEHGFDYTETEDVLAEIKRAADAIIDKKIRRCMLVTAGGRSCGAGERAGRCEGETHEQETACDLGGAHERVD